MQTYDILMLAVLGLSTLHGVWKGMAWQTASLSAIVLSYFLALRFSAPLAPMFGSQGPLNKFVAMFVIYMATSIVVWLSFHWVSAMINRVQLREFDHQVGGLFGAAKGVLWCVAITFFAVSLVPASRDQILDSHSGHYIAVLLDKADQIMPTEIHQVLDPYLNKLETELAPDRDGSRPASKSSPSAPAPRAGQPPTSPATRAAALPTNRTN
jgi:membrane protein required for colicin V production